MHGFTGDKIEVSSYYPYKTEFEATAFSKHLAKIDPETGLASKLSSDSKIETGESIQKQLEGNFSKYKEAIEKTR